MRVRHNGGSERFVCTKTGTIMNSWVIIIGDTVVGFLG